MTVNPEKVNAILDLIDESIFKNDFNDQEFCAESLEDAMFFESDTYRRMKDIVDFAHGTTKMVIIPKNENFVIKIPFKGNYDYPEYSTYNDNSNEDEDEYEMQFIPFKNAEYPLSEDYGDDYCKSEVEFYQIAKEYGVEWAFCETLLFDIRHNVKIYVQEKAIGSEVIPRLSREETLKTCKKKKEYKINNLSNLRALHSLLKVYSVQTLQELDEFLESAKINDLHCDNYGVHPVTKLPVIIDYSGFHG